VPTEPEPPSPEVDAELEEQRWELLHQIDRALDRPLTVLSLAWLILLVVDLLSETGLPTILELAIYAIWAVFIFDFVVSLIIAPSKRTFFRRNWLSAIALIVPALRLLRVFAALRVLRAARLLRSTNLVRVVASANRGLRTTGQVLGQRGAGYMAVATGVVAFVGSAGMAVFESPRSLVDAGSPIADMPGAGLEDYGEALWWTAMTLTTVGGDHSPQTLEGRLLGFLIALWGIGVFGYLVATLASFFVDTDKEARPFGR
jgi:voltage-gated potassium channel